MHLIAAALTTVGNPPTANPSFVFRDWKVGDQYAPRDPRITRCKPISLGNACLFADDRIGGVVARHVGAVFSEHGLFALEARFARRESDTVEAALRARYGKPCEQRVEEKSNMLGQTVQNRIRIWCFADGRATFQTVADTMATESMFQFKTEDTTKRVVTVDF